MKRAEKKDLPILESTTVIEGEEGERINREFQEGIKSGKYKPLSKKCDE